MKISKIFVSAIILTIFGTSSAHSQSLSDLLGGNLGNTISNMVEGVFSSSNISVADMTGTWNSDGPAVCFQSDNFLKNAGGIAAAAAVESKLAPYYQQYGLNNAVLTVQSNGTFTLSLGKLINLNGTITPASGADKGVFNFNFTALGMNIGSVTTYVQKTSGTMDVMFDASKLKGLLTKVGQMTGISIVQTVSSILESYEGLCIGFKFKGGSNSGVSSGSGFGLGDVLNGLGIGGGNSNNNSNQETQPSQQSGNGNSNATNSQQSITNGLNQLRGILGR